MRRLAIGILALVLGAATTGAAIVSNAVGDALLSYGRAELLHQMEAGPRPTPPSAATQTQRACFVTFFSKHKVVACFGSFTPRRSDLATEISENIRLALKNDPRAANLTAEQARACELQITFAAKPEPILDWRQIDPLREGLFVERADGQGVAIVPGEARTASYAYRSAMKRLGLQEGANGVRLYRFKAEVISTRRAPQT